MAYVHIIFDHIFGFQNKITSHIHNGRESRTIYTIYAAFHRESNAVQRFCNLVQ